jgi:NADPH-dependent 2,4-dienoyl-CoA reductase/sulfur reductase-like enzyme
MIDDIELAVVGAGPAGIEAATTAALAGVEVVLIDSSPKPGGQFFQQMPDPFQSDDHSDHHAKTQQLLKRLESTSVHLLQNTLAWGIFEGSKPGTWCLTLHGPDAPTRLNVRAVVLAIGAFDRSIPFPGWDLPGVITAGAAQKMIKNQRVLPGKHAILSGTGPLQLAAAAHLVEAGVEVVAVCETATGLLWRSIPYLPAFWGQWERMNEGLNYVRTLAGAGVPYRMSWAVTSARGGNRVSEVTLAKLDSSGKPIPQTEIIQAVDTVVVGYGLTPSTELCWLLDCELEFDTRRGGYIPCRNEWMETSCPGIYAVGDCAGIGGAEMAMIEGRIAGQAASFQLAHITERSALQAASREKAALRREQRFARMLGDLFSPPAGLYTLAEADTVICRCEQVTLGQVREAISYGAQSVSDVKNLARTGMGNCQGRTCGSIVAQILAAETGRAVEDVQYLTVRPPVHPLPLGVIEEYEQEVGRSDQGCK